MHSQFSLVMKSVVKCKCKERCSFTVDELNINNRLLPNVLVGQKPITNLLIRNRMELHCKIVGSYMVYNTTVKNININYTIKLSLLNQNKIPNSGLTLSLDKRRP